MQKEGWSGAMQESTITQEGKRKLEEELEYLLTVGRDEIAERIAVARSFGDLSENAEYNEAMNEQAKMEARIDRIEQELQNAVIIDESKISTEAVHAGSKVKLLDVDLDKNVEYTILGSTESDPDAGIISDQSPIGKALLGHKKGETVSVEVPSGKVLSFKILKITK